MEWEGRAEGDKEMENEKWRVREKGARSRG